MKIYIKHMVSNRCKMVVREELNKLGLHYIFLEMGEIEVMENILTDKFEILKTELCKYGLELLDDINAILIESIKNSIIEIIYKTHGPLKIEFSRYISEKYNYDYQYLSDMFFEVQGISINQFVLNHKIERIKEIIVYEDLNILEIAQKLNFSSISSLNIQFQKATGFSPYNFKLLKMKRRSVIEGIGLQYHDK